MRDLIVGNDSESGYDYQNFHYEVFNPACSSCGFLFGLMRRRAATANDAAPQGVQLRSDPSARVPTTAAAIQPEWTGSANGYASAGGRFFASAGRCTAHKGGKGRLSVRDPCPWQTASGGEP